MAFVVLVLAILSLQCFSVSAGTVITSNLPPNTAIINISGTADGAAAFNGDQSLWYVEIVPGNSGNRFFRLYYP